MNRYMLIIFLLTSLNFNTKAQDEAEFLPDDWENPAVFEKGQTQPHAFHVPYSSKQSALKNNVDKCGNFQLLNGQWKFKWVETPEQVPQNLPSRQKI